VNVGSYAGHERIALSETPYSLECPEGPSMIVSNELFIYGAVSNCNNVRSDVEGEWEVIGISAGVSGVNGGNVDWRSPVW
jgi:hypothetical protein